MKKNPYIVLFESVKISPVVTKNRFYQVPHCFGMGHLRPQARAARRETKAKGGWGVVSTKESEIHPSSDLSPYAEAPGLIADAIFSGHLAAENFESSEQEIEKAIFMREMPQLKQN